MTRSKAPKSPTTVLRLYIAGSSPRSTRAIQHAKALCETYMAGHYDLQVIDIFQQPALAKDDQILAVPTLVRKQPTPIRQFIGDLSKQDVVLAGLGLKPR